MRNALRRFEEKRKSGPVCANHASMVVADGRCGRCKVHLNGIKLSRVVLQHFLGRRLWPDKTPVSQVGYAQPEQPSQIRGRAGARGRGLACTGVGVEEDDRVLTGRLPPET